MAHRFYPFIDIAVQDLVRARFLNADAIAILSSDLEEMIWANGPGAALFGQADIEAARGAASGLAYAARRQIAATPGFPDIGADRAIVVRFAQGITSRAVGLLASAITLPGGEAAILLVAPTSSDPDDARAVATRAISGIAEAGHFAALIDDAGNILSATKGFDALGIEPGTLAEFAAEVSREADRLAKRPLPAGDLLYPAGIARLGDEPGRHLVIVVDDPQPVESRSQAEATTAPADSATSGAASAAVHAPVASDDTDTWYFADTVSAASSRQEAKDNSAPEEAPLHASTTEPETHSAEDAAESRSGQTARKEVYSLLDLTSDDDVTIDAETLNDLRSSDPQAEEEATDTRSAGFVDESDEARGSWRQNNEPSTTRDTIDTAESEAHGEPSRVPEAPTDISQQTAPLDDGDLSGDGTTMQAGLPARPLLHSPGQSPVRFVWKTDALGRFSSVSDEFAGAVGAGAADIMGRSFRDVSLAYGLDPDGEIAGLLERRDTWSGRSVMWPIEGTDLRVPVDLAALPVYARDRSFEGFRGFGVVRVDDVVVDPDATGLSLSGAPIAAPSTGEISESARPDPFNGELPAIAIDDTPDRRLSDKVVRLAEHRPSPSERTLSAGERIAFREIGARLKDADTIKPSAVKDEEGAALPRLGKIAHSADDDTATAGDVSAEPAPRDQPAHFAEGEEHRSSREDEDARIAAEIPDDSTSADRGSGGASSGHEEASIAHGGHDAVDGSAQAPEPSAASDESAESNGQAEPKDEFLPSAFSQPSGDGHAGSGVDTSILARLPIPVLIHSGDSLHYANEEFLDLTGYVSVLELEQAGGLGVLFAEEEGEERDPADHRRRLRTRDGDEFPVDALLQSVPWDGRKALLLALKPAIPPAPAAKPEELSELEARVAEMRTILDTATDGIVILGQDGTIRSISRPAEALFGFDTAAVAGKPFVSLFAVESQRAARDYLNGLSENGVASVLNDGREVIGREAQGRFIPLFMTIGKLPNESGFCAVLRDITQWKRAEEELTQARTEAERSSSQKTEFLARISHEIRTPLNAIIGFSELMIDEKFGPIVNDRYRDYLRDINRSGNHVLDLVNDLLDISKIEAGEQEMAYEAVSLNETLAEAVAMMQPQANRNRVIIRSSFASKLPEVVADLRSIRQIALNLLSNAVRYTQAGGQVIVSTAYEPTGDVVMRVRDTGVGMSQGEIEQALKPFKQINALKRPRGDGTGLGLPLTKAMVEANRARFSISSAPAEGTMVEIVFPSTRVLAG